MLQTTVAALEKALQSGEDSLEDAIRKTQALNQGGAAQREQEVRISACYQFISDPHYTVQAIPIFQLKITGFAGISVGFFSSLKNCKNTMSRCVLPGH